NTGFIRIAVTNPSTPPDHNDMYRSTPSENSGAAMRVASGLKVNGIYTDHAIASGLTYSYFVRAVDAGGSPTADSTVSTGTVSLGYARLHCVIRNGLSAQIVGQPADLFNQIPNVYEAALSAQAFPNAGSKFRPLVALSDIEANKRSFTIRVPALNDDWRT